jgi:hypothetical protein
MTEKNTCSRAVSELFPQTRGEGMKQTVSQHSGRESLHKTDILAVCPETFWEPVSLGLTTAMYFPQ